MITTLKTTIGIKRRKERKLEILSNEELIHKGNLEITTKIGCTNMCEYCPQVKLINQYKIGKERVTKDERFMSVDNF